MQSNIFWGNYTYSHWFCHTDFYLAKKWAWLFRDFDPFDTIEQSNTCITVKWYPSKLISYTILFTVQFDVYSPHNGISELNFLRCYKTSMFWSCLRWIWFSSYYTFIWQTLEHMWNFLFMHNTYKLHIKMANLQKSSLYVKLTKSKLDGDTTMDDWASIFMVSIIAIFPFGRQKRLTQVMAPKKRSTTKLAVVWMKRWQSNELCEQQMHDIACNIVIC